VNEPEPAGRIDGRALTLDVSGALAILEIAVAPSTSGPPLYQQPSLDEMFYVVEGRLTFRVGDVLLTALPGGSVVVPRGVARSYSNRSDEVARVLVICSPGFELHGESAHKTRIVGPPLEL
jgi:mannose-6-phosphate isomerase-like protein (cupin superfamily)